MQRGTVLKPDAAFWAEIEAAGRWAYEYGRKLPYRVFVHAYYNKLAAAISARFDALIYENNAEKFGDSLLIVEPWRLRILEPGEAAKPNEILTYHATDDPKLRVFRECYVNDTEFGIHLALDERQACTRRSDEGSRLLRIGFYGKRFGRVPDACDVRSPTWNSPPIWELIADHAQGRPW